MEKNMEHEMETAIYIYMQGYVGDYRDYSLNSVLVSSLISPMVVPYIIPFKESRL